jgi:alkanesulfonate monooxygenase SsuD/methylene tetrahydromethanopterin reductase-like flavin-dependent oxidoreductase (luciferase family)
VHDLTKVLDVAHGHFASFWISDHFVSPAYRLECWTLLTWMAARYPEPMLGTHVMANAHRHPAVTAKMAATLQVLSNNRVILGYGAASDGPEHQALGLEFPPPRERIARMVEGIQVMRALWTQSTANFQGKYYQIADCSYEPRPSVVPPIAIGGEGEKYLLRAVAQHAGWWITQMFPPAELRHKMSILRQHCHDVGRDPSQIHVGYPLICYLANSRSQAEHKAGAKLEQPRPPFAGEPAALRDFIAEIVDIGVDRIQMVLAGFPDTTDIELFVDKVLPSFK